MVDSISVVKPKEKPRYKLLKAFYVNDQYISEDTEIEWTGVPNEQMEPLNDMAVEKMTAYLLTLEGGRTPRVEDLMYQTMLKRPKEAAEVTIPKAVQDVPQMGSMRSPRETDVKITAEPPTVKLQKKLMGTIVEDRQGGPSI
jgi:hypothetical protein